MNRYRPPLVSEVGAHSSYFNESTMFLSLKDGATAPLSERA